MFDIAFSEMVVIAVVALIVIGPERLPKVARTLGHLWGRAQRYINGVKADLARDMAVDELRQLQKQVQQQADQAQQAVKQFASTTEQEVKQLNEAVTSALSEPAPAPTPHIPKQARLNLDAPEPVSPEAQKKIFPVD